MRHPWRRYGRGLDNRVILDRHGPDYEARQRAKPLPAWIKEARDAHESNRENHLHAGYAFPHPKGVQSRCAHCAQALKRSVEAGTATVTAKRRLQILEEVLTDGTQSHLDWGEPIDNHRRGR